MTNGFSPEQLAQLKQIVRDGVHEAMDDVGFKLDEQHKEETQETIRFLFHLRRMWNSAVTRIGSAIMTAFIAIVFGIIGLGFWAWIKNGGQ